ncbi:hypothetical protein BAUCODRAFT_118193 [Baudoinia panamericana UAMH 10762]|uniref:Uncharacterized protein n=1 Tax=Baudoinia panamericana (strain UAMH 10762) TaxID=717646 RepID=M2MU21_BAUPA|nr:uncharacterized protein BAUCODRAFT_118193 [Baudoinia panamericana UAMH 10762]EMD00422.1 hypothetical protein BAUCODRAFT_118193 [Baudoinia panamericana UAMH 10762]
MPSIFGLGNQYFGGRMPFPRVEGARNLATSHWPQLDGNMALAAQIDADKAGLNDGALSVWLQRAAIAVAEWWSVHTCLPACYFFSYPSNKLIWAGNTVTMLRCPPSVVKLDSTDIIDFEYRHAVRQQTRLLAGPNIRLSPGPGHQIRLAVVSEDHNVGRHRAISSSSRATICSAEDETLDESQVAAATEASIGTWTVSTPSNVLLASSVQHRRCLEVTATPDTAALQRTPPLLLNAVNDCLRSTTHAYGGVVQASSVSNLCVDGAAECSAMRSSAVHADARAPTPAAYCISAAPASTPRRRLPAMFSSARARRRHAHSRDVHVPAEDPLFQRWIERRNVAESPEAGSNFAEISSPVPELIITEEQTHDNATLDPAAPVFVPRTRFGTATASSDDSWTIANLDLRWGTVDSTRSSTDLRLRSSSEQNLEPAMRHRRRAGLRNHQQHGSAYRMQDETTEQNQAGPNLERYPLLRPSHRLAVSRRNSGSHRPVPSAGRRTSRAPSAYALRAPSAAHAAHIQARNLFAGEAVPHLAEEQAYAERTRVTSTSTLSVSAASSASALFRPRHPQPPISTRSSSLASISAVSSPLRRIPSMVSAASGISSAPPSRHCSTEGFNAAAELLRMRGSPLDDLTERLSRVHPGRPRSFGRSWEGAGRSRARVSLLTGNPFQQDSDSATPEPRSPMAASNVSLASRADTPVAHGIVPAPEIMPSLPQPVELPGSLPIHRTSLPVPSTPPVVMHVRQISSPRSPLADLSPGKTRGIIGSLLPRKPATATTTTPKVAVYDDSLVPQTQPQTPADITRSTRRTRIRSDTALKRTDSDRTTVSAPSRHVQRNTYPSTVPIQQSSEPPPFHEVITPAPAVAARNAHAGSSVQHHRTVRRSDENELEANLPSLQDERRTWLERREAGSLEITPPGEGRFERYLS